MSQQDIYTQEQLEQEEQEIIKKLKKIRAMRGVNPIPSTNEMESKEEKVIDAQYRRLDPETGQEQGVLDDLAKIGFREVLANPSDPAAQIAFLKNLKNRPDIIEKTKEAVMSEEFLKDSMIALGGAFVGFWARGKLDKHFKGFDELL